MERTMTLDRLPVRRVSRLRWQPATGTSKCMRRFARVVAMCASVECGVREWTPEWSARLREELLNKEGVTQYVG